MTGGAFLKKPSWSLLAMPTGQIGTSWGTAGKTAIAVGLGAVAGATLLGTKNMLDQQQTQGAKTGGFIVYAQPGSQVTLNEPKTGDIQQEQKQQAEQKPTDYMQIVLIGALVIGAIYMLKGQK